MFGSLLSWGGSQQATGRDETNPLLYLAFNQSNSHFAAATLRGYHVFQVDNGIAERACRFFQLHSDAAGAGAVAASDDASSTMSSISASATTVSNINDASQDSYGSSEADRQRYAKDNLPDPGPFTGKYTSRYYGIGLIEMLFRSNLVAVVGGGPNPLCGRRNQVHLYDDQSQQIVGTISVVKPIKAIRLHRQVIVVATDNMVMVYDHDLRQTHAWESTNPRGLLALSPDADNSVLAFPAVQRGMVRIENMTENTPRHIRAHDGDIACLAISRDGRRLATASDKGTVIRVFDTSTGNKLTEVRRGTSNQTIYSIAFSNDNRFLACCSSSGTVHLFDITPAASALADTHSPNSDAQGNRTSSLSVLSYVGVEYAASQWSMNEYKIQETPALVAFGPSNHQVRVVTYAGTFYDLQFGQQSGDVKAKKEVFFDKLVRE